MRASAVADLLLWVGDYHPVVDAFQGVLEVERVDSMDPVYAKTDRLRAVVLRADQQRPRIVAHFLSHIPVLAARGVSVIITGDTDSLAVAQRQLGTENDVLYQDLTTYGVLLRVLRTPILTIPSQQLTITGSDLDSGARLLFGRAFADCKTIELRELPGGRTGKTWVVHVTFSASGEGPIEPLPFFVKMAERRRIIEELQNYERFVDDFIPFSVRPHIDTTRCCRTTRPRALLVARFVEDAEPFLDVVRKRLANLVIASLFDKSLRGWHQQAVVRNDSFRALEGRFLRKTEHLREVAEQLGIMQQVHAAMEAVFAAGMAYHGPCHGDLHAGNILVTRHDAVIIDFEKVFDGPQAIDPATMEVSIVFDGAHERDDPDLAGVAEVMFRVEEILRPSRILRRQPGAWLFDAVRQIRRMALASVKRPEEYGWAVAAALLRYAGLRAATPLESHRRHLAIRTGVRLVQELSHAG